MGLIKKSAVGLLRLLGVEKDAIIKAMALWPTKTNSVHDYIQSMCTAGGRPVMQLIWVPRTDGSGQMETLMCLTEMLPDGAMRVHATMPIDRVLVRMSDGLTTDELAQALEDSIDNRPFSESMQARMRIATEMMATLMPSPKKIEQPPGQIGADND